MALKENMKNIAKLAGVADWLKWQAKKNSPFNLVFMTDQKRIARPDAVIQAMPAGSCVIFRDYEHPKRAAEARRLCRVASRRGLIFLVANDAPLAAEIGAHGTHLPAFSLKQTSSRPTGLLSASCHNAEEIKWADEMGVDVILLSPLFKTKSHPGASAMARNVARRLVASTHRPVLALGGVSVVNAKSLGACGFAGIAAIDAFARH